jgi:hypothetical protein
MRPLPPNSKQHLKFGNSFAVRDPEALKLLCSIDPIPALSDENIADVFCKEYVQWINNGTLNVIKGLDEFPHLCFSNGTTEAFDKFYMKHRNRRLRVFRGEYMYHQLTWRNNWPNWFWLDDDCLAENDAVVVSLPFADTGNEHHLHQALLEGCDKLGIPVLVDCAYFGICQDIVFDFNHPCIEEVVFSLSKTFPVAHSRIGMRLSRSDNDDSLFVLNKSAYVNRMGAYIGLQFLKNFSPDYIPLKYKSLQLEFCQHLNVTPSNTVLFGIGGDEWQEYNRGCSTNRLSLHKYLHDKQQFYIDNVQG